MTLQNIETNYELLDNDNVEYDDQPNISKTDIDHLNEYEYMKNY